MTAHPTQNQTWKILCVTEGQPPGLLRQLRELGTVRAVSNVADAVTALRESPFDFVVAPIAELSPLANRLHVASAETILDRIGQGVCIVDRSGKLAWANQKLKTYPAEAVEKVQQTCARLFAEFEKDLAKPESARNRRRSIQIGGDLFFEMTASPLLDGNGQIVEVVGLLWDTTSMRRLQEKINAIDSAGRELVRLDAGAAAEMSVTERLQFLEDKIIRYSRDLMHFDHFAVRILDRQTRRLDTVIASGFSEEAKSLDIYAEPEGNGISGYVAATGRSYICPDISKDPRYLKGLDNARSSLTVPLRLHDHIIGVLNVESERIAAFSEDDRQFAEIFGRYIAIALHILKLLVVERHATSGQLAADVGAELAAPLNDIIADASFVMEEFIGHDEVRARLHAIIDNVSRVKKSLSQLAEPRGIRGIVPDAPAFDPLIRNRRILIVEDEEVIRETIADVLNKCGAATTTASDGQAAIDLLQAQRFDLVLSDIIMPNKSGYEVFSAVKAAHADCPVILITGFGYDPEHNIVRASKEGLAGVLFKPFKVEQLIDSVRNAIAD